MDCIRVPSTGSSTGVTIIGVSSHLCVDHNMSDTSVHFPVFRELSSRFESYNGVGRDFASTRIPFFFEPNFEAFVKPLDAALRIQAEDPKSLHPGEGTTAKPKYEPVRYGEFLKKKVGNNFDLGKGKYD